MGYGKNWMHFMYKMDNLFRSIRVSYGNLSVTKGFHFLNLFELLTFSVFKMHEVSGFHTKTRLLQTDFIFLNLFELHSFFCVQNAPFKATSSIYNPFWLHMLFFMNLLIILSYKTLKLKSISNELWKGWKLAWYHHFIHIACAR